MDESRKQFEKYLIDELGYRSDYLSHWVGDGNFKHHPTLRSLWQGWQASRAVIEIELPPTIEVHPLGPSTAKMFCELHKNTVAECAKSIRAAGLKVKEG